VYGRSALRIGNFSTALRIENTRFERVEGQSLFIEGGPSIRRFGLPNNKMPKTGESPKIVN
jgi:hypothetical protein